jgi:2-phospho-L-lactate guanylyltransferase
MRRPVWAVVPAKSPVEGKSRLRPVLGDADRAHLAQALLEHVLDVLSACGLDGVLVATGGDDVASLAAARGAHVLRDHEPASLADVVDRALVGVASRGAASALVLMADLPRIQPADVEAVLAALDDHDAVLVCDHLGYHTNALALSPPTAMTTRFGRENSFAAHCAAARAAGLRAGVVVNENIAFDVDLPADHRRLTMGRPAVGT